MGQPRKHSAIIKAWADGAEIQYRYNDNDEWKSADTPTWISAKQYRVKPQTKRIRLYLWEDGRIYVINESDSNREQYSGFVKWLGDWQEIEV